MRPLYQRICVDRLARVALLSPVWVTLIGCAFGILAAIFISLRAPFLGVIFLLLSGYCDTLDGTIARTQGKISSAGSALDIVCDRVVEAAILIGLWTVNPSERSLIVLLMLASVLICVSSFLVVGIFAENDSSKSFHYSSGLIERAEAFLFFTLMILFPALFLPLGWLFFSLVTLTAITRLYQFCKC